MLIHAPLRPGLVPLPRVTQCCVRVGFAGLAPCLCPLPLLVLHERAHDEPLVACHCQHLCPHLCVRTVIQPVPVPPPLGPVYSLAPLFPPLPPSPPGSYGYFAAATVGVQVPWKRYITLLQISQFVFDIVLYVRAVVLLPGFTTTRTSHLTHSRHPLLSHTAVTHIHTYTAAPLSPTTSSMTPLVESGVPTSLATLWASPLSSSLPRSTSASRQPSAGKQRHRRRPRAYKQGWCHWMEWEFEHLILANQTTIKHPSGERGRGLPSGVTELENGGDQRECVCEQTAAGAAAAAHNHNNSTAHTSPANHNLQQPKRGVANGADQMLKKQEKATCASVNQAHAKEENSQTRSASHTATQTQASKQASRNQSRLLCCALLACLEWVLGMLAMLTLTSAPNKLRKQLKRCTRPGRSAGPPGCR